MQLLVQNCLDPACSKWGLFIFISRESKWGTLQSAGNPRCAVPAEIHSICTDWPRPGPAAGLQVSPTSDISQSVAILMNRPHCLDPSRATEIFSVPKRRIFAFPKIVRYRNKSGLQYSKVELPPPPLLTTNPTPSHQTPSTGPICPTPVPPNPPHPTLHYARKNKKNHLCKIPVKLSAFSPSQSLPSGPLA